MPLWTQPRSVVERYHSWENTQVCRNTRLCISPFEDSGFPTQTEAWLAHRRYLLLGGHEKEITEQSYSHHGFSLKSQKQTTLQWATTARFLKHPHKHSKNNCMVVKKKGHKSSLIKLEGWPYCGRSGTALLSQLATHKVIVPNNKSHLLDPKMTLSGKHTWTAFVCQCVMLVRSDSGAATSSGSSLKVPHKPECDRKRFLVFDQSGH